VDIPIVEWAQPIAKFVIVVMLASLFGKAFLILARSSTSPKGMRQMVLADELA
jgi:hypothetical protein